MNRYYSSILPLLFGAAFLFGQSAQVGINTESPHSSSILEVSGGDINGSTTKKGFLPPRVTLLSATDAATIPNPATGLLVFNTQDSGVFPNKVNANQYYYWVGNRWERLVYTSAVVEAVKPRVFYAESKTTQTFTSAQINSADDTTPPADNFVIFDEAPIVNSNNFIVFNNANSTFKVTVAGIYEVSSFVNYNPMAAGYSGYVNNRAFLNLKIQVSTNNGVSWQDSMGSRTAWGEDGASTLKTAVLLGTPIQLNEGDMLRVVIANPFGRTAKNNHGYLGQNSFIANDVANHIPVAKSIRIQLLDYNIN